MLPTVPSSYQLSVLKSKKLAQFDEAFELRALIHVWAVVTQTMIRMVTRGFSSLGRRPAWDWCAHVAHRRCY